MISKAAFLPDSGMKEYFFSLNSIPDRSFDREAEALLSKYLAMAAGSFPVWARFHLSDPANQTAQLRLLAAKLRCPVSIIGQAPADGGRIALEAYHLAPAPECESDGSAVLVKLANYRLHWHFGRAGVETGSAAQTRSEFRAEEQALAALGGTIERNLQRTWLYCRDIDNNYAGLVDARRELFREYGLTEHTHYVASTGIEGFPAEPGRLVQMDSFALFGHEPGQIQYLSAPDHLSPTHVYGVTFERGTRIIFGDRSHYYISGTASIDKAGHTLYPNQVVAQTERLIENVAALLKSGGATLADLKQAVIYLRDPADRDLVEDVLSERLDPGTARLTVRGSVCRPSWLVEMEAIGVNANGDSQFKSFL